MNEPNKRKLRVLYAGTPSASAAVLESLILRAEKEDSGFEISGALTNPPAPRGRKKEPEQSEVAVCAMSRGIKVFSFEHLDSAARSEIACVGADILVCFDYGHIFGPKFLSLFPLGGINLHPSALPKYRGCAPVQAAILNGDGELGICVQKIALATDEGDVLACALVSLDGSETTESLMSGTVAEKGSELLCGILLETAASQKQGEFRLPPAEKQIGEASYTHLLKKEDGIIDWNKSARQIERQIRAYTPWPLSVTFEKKMGAINILKARVLTGETSDCPPGTVLPYDKSVGIKVACADGSILVITELQRQTKKATDYKSFMNGARDFSGTRFTCKTERQL